MATKEDYNHIHADHEKSYGHLKQHHDAHLTDGHTRGSHPGRHGHTGADNNA